MGTEDGDGARPIADSRATSGNSKKGVGCAVAAQNAGFVYFLETGDRKLVKVGHSKNPYHRLLTLASVNGEDLRMIGCFPGNQHTERWIHGKFSHLRTIGKEWFRSTVELRAFIDSMGLIKPGSEPIVYSAFMDKEPNEKLRKKVFAWMGRKGGPARAKALTPERRQEIGRNAIAARWAKKRRSDAEPVPPAA